MIDFLLSSHLASSLTTAYRPWTSFPFRLSSLGSPVLGTAAPPFSHILRDSGLPTFLTRVTHISFHCGDQPTKLTTFLWSVRTPFFIYSTALV